MSYPPKTHTSEKTFTDLFNRAYEDEMGLINLLQRITKELNDIEDELHIAMAIVKDSTELLEKFTQYRSLVRNKLAKVISQND